MGLQGYELDIIKQQLGYPLTRIGAEPYITFVALFDKVIQPYLFDNSTTSATVITGTGLQTFTVASNPVAPNNSAFQTFAVGTSCVVDVGPNQETVVLTSVVGTTFGATFVNAHAAGFTIWPNGAEWAVRGILARIASIEVGMNARAPLAAGIKQVDEIQTYASTKVGNRAGTRDMFESLTLQRDVARDDLAAAIGVPNLWRARAGGGSSGRVEVY